MLRCAFNAHWMTTVLKHWLADGASVNKDWMTVLITTWLDGLTPRT